MPSGRRAHLFPPLSSTPAQHATAQTILPNIANALPLNHQLPQGTTKSSDGERMVVFTKPELRDLSAPIAADPKAKAPRGGGSGGGQGAAVVAGAAVRISTQQGERGGGGS